MKTIKIIALLSLVTFGALHAQDKRLAIKINPLSIFAATINVSSEFFLNDKMSVQLGLYYGQLSTSFGGGGATGKFKYSWLGITPEFRYYFGVGAMSSPSGLYVGAFGRFRNIGVDYTATVFDPDSNTNLEASAKTDINAFGGGILVGFEVITEGGFVFDTFLGPQFSSARLTTTVECTGCDGDEIIGDFAGISFSGVGLRFGMGLGYAF